MARIDMTLDTSATLGVRDEPCLIDPYEGAGWVDRGLRYCWLTIPGLDGDSLQLHLANGLSTDAQILASTHLLIAALTELRDAAAQRIAEANVVPTDMTPGELVEAWGK